MKNKILNFVESNYIYKNINLKFKVGNLLEVKIWVFEGKKKRIQSFEGIVIAKRNRGINSSFTIRKISYGEGVERVFHVYSPIIKNIIVKNIKKVRKSKLYYLRYSNKNLFKKLIN